MHVDEKIVGAVVHRGKDGRGIQSNRLTCMRESKRGRERGERRREGGKREGEGEADLLGCLFQLLNVQLTDLVVVVDGINGVTQYLMEEGQGNNL